MIYTCLLGIVTTSTSIVSMQDAPTEPSPAGQPEASAIIDRYLEATGGRAAWESLTSIRGMGTVEFMGSPIKGQMATYQTANTYRRSLDANGLLAQVTVRNGDQAWGVRQDGAVRDIKGQELRSLIRDGGFNPLLHVSTLYSTLEVVGVEQVDETQAWKIRCVPADEPGAEEFRFFAIDSGLQIKVVEIGPGDSGSMPMELFLSDYRPVGPVQIAHQSLIAVGRSRIAINMAAMQINAVIPECLFEKPEGEMVKAEVETPREALEAFMRIQIDSLNALQTQRWMERLDAAASRITDQAPNAESMRSVFAEIDRTLREHLAALQPS
ncbi:MAG: hypothetical protein MK100_07745 [Phycisphaerales bacterium]|nr:hypothetical protein [Phycisphaerales bacterium]